MRKMLLSFKPNIYEKIKSGTKIFEHRRRFPNEPIIAYMYVSKPVKAITGILLLNNQHKLTDWLVEFSSDLSAVERVTEYSKSYNFAMEIAEFQETSSISLAEIKNKFPNFNAPQSYLYLDNYPELLEYIEKNIIYKDIHIKHDFSNIESSQICVH